MRPVAKNDNMFNEHKRLISELMNETGLYEDVMIYMEAHKLSFDDQNDRKSCTLWNAIILDFSLWVFKGNFGDPPFECWQRIIDDHAPVKNSNVLELLHSDCLDTVQFLFRNGYRVDPGIFVIKNYSPPRAYVELFLENGADPNAKDEEGRTFVENLCPDIYTVNLFLDHRFVISLRNIEFARGRLKIFLQEKYVNQNRCRRAARFSIMALSVPLNKDVAKLIGQLVWGSRQERWWETEFQKNKVLFMLYVL
jgi:hypothetical protein